MAIYSSPGYAMGATTAASTTTVVTGSEKTKAEHAIRGMRKSLKGWLKYRDLLEASASGVRVAKLPRSAVQALFTNRDVAREQRLANSLHALLGEMFDARTLPDPNLARNPDGAVELAKIAIAGKLSNESTGSEPEAVGFIWLWPAVVVVGIVAVTIMYKIKSDADALEEQAHQACIAAGQCTDYGFWLKVGAVAFVGWLAWEKFGLKKKFD